MAVRISNENWIIKGTGRFVDMSFYSSLRRQDQLNEPSRIYGGAGFR